MPLDARERLEHIASYSSANRHDHRPRDHLRDSPDHPRASSLRISEVGCSFEEPSEGRRDASSPGALGTQRTGGSARLGHVRRLVRLQIVRGYGLARLVSHAARDGLRAGDVPEGVDVRGFGFARARVEDELESNSHVHALVHAFEDVERVERVVVYAPELSDDGSRRFSLGHEVRDAVLAENKSHGVPCSGGADERCALLLEETMVVEAALESAVHEHAVWPVAARARHGRDGHSRQRPRRHAGPRGVV